MPMWYWRDDNFKGLAAVSAIASCRPELREYAEYLQLRERGLRKASLSHLDAFLEAARQWPFEQRRAFVDWLMALHYQRPEIIDLIPHPLYARLVDPTLTQWIEAEPRNPAPLRWRSTPDDLRKAISLDPAEQIARERLLRHLTRSVDYSMHELQNGYGYIGDPVDDLSLLEEASSVAQNLADAELKAVYLQEIIAMHALARSYLEYRASGSSDSYAEWAAQNGRPIRTRICHVYAYSKGR